MARIGLFYRSRSSYFYSHSPKKPVEAFDKAFLGGLRLIKDCFKVKTEVECILNDTLIMPFRKQVFDLLFISTAGIVIPVLYNTHILTKNLDEYEKMWYEGH